MVLLLMIVIDLAPHFEVINKMIKHNEEEEEQRKRSLGCGCK